MGRRTAEVSPGDIFMIPLFLPAHSMDDYDTDYSKYQFHLDDIYAFGRLVEIQAGNVDLIEVFSYTGQVPQSPENKIHSGRMFAPEHIGHPFSQKGRWKVIFSNPHYDMWKGKETITVTEKERIELEEAGTPIWIMNTYIDLEVRIRSMLEAQGIELNYGQIVDERKSEYPKPKDLGKKLKETIAPFRWRSGQGRYTLSLDAGLLNCGCFARNNMLGNGYDWEKVASAFIEMQGIDSD